MCNERRQLVPRRISTYAPPREVQLTNDGLGAEAPGIHLTSLAASSNGQPLLLARATKKTLVAYSWSLSKLTLFLLA